MTRATDRGFALGFVIVLASLALQAANVALPTGTLPATPVPVAFGVAIGGTVIFAIVLMSLRRRVRAGLRTVDREFADLREAYDRARLDSLLDALTGLGNHRAFQEELDARIAQARDEDQPLSLVMIDVDDLKTINDQKGHAAGDDLLRSVAMIMRANLRRGDGAYRTGGDEFALLLPHCDADDAAVIANHLLASALSGNQGRTGAFSVTIGISCFPDLSADRHQIIHHADAALYAGKRHGRTNVQRFDPARHGIAEDSRSLAQLEAAVVRVASEDLLRAVYQPIYSLESGTIVGFEGLVRPLPESGFSSPTSLFVAAEATRRTVELDVVCARAVLAGAGALGEDRYLSINLSPRTLESDAFSVQEIMALARRHGIPPSQLVVELTERESVDDLRRLQQAISALRRNDVRVAIDDVGAGNAGLRLLSEVEYDILKIDLSLVRASATHGASEAVLRALGTLARNRGHRIVAEGIETADHLESVLELRYDAGQGYLFGRAEPTLDRGPIDLFALLSATDEGQSAA
ncbi:MAG TPA: EAL domain-containing protein [Candidatus Limnocylindrales bacterium]|nr:EAL domain-containing protein [Candidatus Limnocylindrales bacterium]